LKPLFNGLSKRREIHIFAHVIVNGIKPRAAGLALFALGWIWMDSFELAIFPVSAAARS
jgi:hypothetical protein